ncbi:VCBS repeat domain-containing M23 family metallopeptidase [Microbacterium oxydans]|uniref:VCBS repeat domain-containing M23 family metallopeptidase n=1 Tax=Microbacterium oxydans TaxID=82380 RepID=UPI000B83817E|nr:VCBS repeat domain-containing M23 family metallopeptidase [Microbacterium oxydans]
MKRTLAPRRARIGMLAALAVAVGALTPFVAEPPAAQAAYGAMVQPASGKILSRVDDGCGNPRDHEGIDISNNGGTPIIAAYGGTVSARTYSSGYGNYVVISHPGGYTTLYAHMVSPGSVNLGQAVTKGQQIGVVGSTGNSSGPHLHFELRRDGANIANQGYTCNTNVTRGNAIPMDFPGLGAGGGGGYDINSDGHDDVLGGDTDMTAYYGNGAGGLTGQTLGSGWGTTTAIVRGDFNGDGNGDIVTVRNDGNQWFYRGNGASSFNPTQVGHGWANMSLITGGADFNSDGRADIVARAADGNLYAYRGNGSGSFPEPLKIGNNWSGITAAVAGYFNGDAYGDIIARNSAGLLFLYAGTGYGIGAGTQIGNGWNGMSVITGGGDYNTDGKADIIARDASGNLLLYPGTGSGVSNPTQIGHGWNNQRLIG